MLKLSLKSKVLNALFRDENEVQVIIEMYVAKTKDFKKRAQYYVDQLYLRQANKGDQYEDLKALSLSP